ncbi:hypothetical protein TG4357_02948 [Thalassovita gelatinovora]|uniref:TonB C-terminal domain-containing protein n=1 Tax=Thalassovita gelatinovora TaxID=53501 RepID=A0A0P1G227_THAGE|nr:energy transducer TonB [Thalassovita gelatinovora]QIZ81944.1 energy transducer TonB [Thalassovita gelatinovora]CUH67339.1 hypothetical protein TG4357_02948 [Thalassovita gelatinovora]SEP76039.1 outer membrane transport energization protein TonB [Thalassovita gelatinovora]
MLAGALHMAVFQGMPGGGVPAAGDGGGDTVTLVASSASLSAMVAEWDRPVEVLQQITSPELSVTTASQDQPPVSALHSEPMQRPALSTITTPALDGGDLPAIDETVPPPSNVAVTASLRPQERPNPPRTTRSRPANLAQPSSRQTAAGSGQNHAAGTDGAATTPTTRQALRTDLMAQWGNSIRAAVERRKRYPSGTRARGTVILSIAVSSTGALASVKVRKSSGDAALDQAALMAVRRARFATAPKGLAVGVHHFSLPISFAL